MGDDPGLGDTGVKAEGLVKIFKDKKRGQVRAVDDVSFEAHPGEVFGLLGINGAGKTTTLRMLSTMLKPTSGDASVCGFSVTRQGTEVRRNIGFMSTATSLYGRLTAREMVVYFGKLNRMHPDKIEKRMKVLFELFDMNEFADTRCDKLSTGMKQKVSIVRTVLHDPQVMIFDEPTAGLDVLTSRTIVDFVRQCRIEKKCVIFSTHIMDEVDKLCDRVGLIHNGKLLACEPIEDLKSYTDSGRVEDAFVKIVEAKS